jgi:predicted acyl esterase
MGPGHHGQQNLAGFSLGVFRWSGDTSRQFREDMLKPFFDSYLVEGAPRAKLSPVSVYNAGSNRWEHAQRWPWCQGPITR